MIIGKDMLKEFVEQASAQKVKDFANRLIDQMSQNQLNAIEQGFKVSLHWQGGDTPEPEKPARTPVMRPETMPIQEAMPTRRGRPPKIPPPPPLPSEEEEGDEDDAEELFDELDKSLAIEHPVKKITDDAEDDYNRTLANLRRQRT